jgi:hypothetical protein
MTLDEVHQEVSAFLTEAERFFKPGVKLTFIMRRPDNDECDILITDDSLDELAAVIERMKKREKEKADGG